MMTVCRITWTPSDQAELVRLLRLTVLRLELHLLRLRLEGRKK